MSSIRIIAAVRCSYCNGDYVSLGRHLWRCKARVTSSASVAPTTPVLSPQGGSKLPDGVHGEPNNSAPTNDTETCACGRKCKGRRGLKAHQRACGFFKSLVAGNILVQPPTGPMSPVVDLSPPTAAPSPLTLNSPSTSHSTSSPTLINFDVKPGLKLPKNKERWAEANSYFHGLFASRIVQPVINLDDEVQRAQDEVYSYFAESCGTLPMTTDNKLTERYVNQPVKSLKRSLVQLKKSKANTDSTELRFVSSLIRSKLKKSANQYDESNCLERELRSKFWSKCHSLFATISKCVPTFNVITCFNYFVSTLSQPDKLKSFMIPQWVPTLQPPSCVHEISAPTYKAVVRAINKARAGSSACPLDQLSILILKHCPILRTLLHHYVVECWAQRKIPKCWKRGATILIYKKGDTNDPSNFRPITLQPVWYKSFHPYMQ